MIGNDTILTMNLPADDVRALPGDPGDSVTGPAQFTAGHRKGNCLLVIGDPCVINSAILTYPLERG